MGNILMIAGIIVGIVVVVFLYFCCVISGKSSEREERIYNKYLKQNRNEKDNSIIDSTPTN